MIYSCENIVDVGATLTTYTIPSLEGWEVDRFKHIYIVLDYWHDHEHQIRDCCQTRRFVKDLCNDEWANISVKQVVDGLVCSCRVNKVVHVDRSVEYRDKIT